MTLPRIDLEGSHADVASAIDRALREVGFFAVVRHGVDPSTIDAAWRATQRFFDLPRDQKLAFRSDDPEYPYGYVPVANEALAGAHGRADALPDLKETFNLAPASRERKWPDEVDGFRQSWLDYYSAMETLAERLMRHFARALDLDLAYFDDKIDQHVSALRALNYPALDTAPASGQLRAGSHTDYGTLTVLKPGPASRGLQVETVDGQWVDVPMVDDGFVVNIGDLMAMWTNDRWRSTPHRVINPDSTKQASERRQSMAFFHQPNADAEVVCLPTCTSPDNPPRYPTVRSGEWLIERVKAARAEE